MIRFLYCWTSIFQISIDLYCDKCFLFFPFPKPIRRLSPPPSLFFPLSKDPRYNSVKKKRGLNPSKLRDIREIEIDSARKSASLHSGDCWLARILGHAGLPLHFSRHYKAPSNWRANKGKLPQSETDPGWFSFLIRSNI